MVGRGGSPGRPATRLKEECFLGAISQGSTDYSPWEQTQICSSESAKRKLSLRFPTVGCANPKKADSAMTLPCWAEATVAGVTPRNAESLIPCASGHTAPQPSAAHPKPQAMPRCGRTDRQDASDTSKPDNVAGKSSRQEDTSN